MKYKGNYHAEQDARYEPERCSVTKQWSNTKRVLLKTWTIYERVFVDRGGPSLCSYQTPRFFCKNEKEALEKLKTLS